MENSYLGEFWFQFWSHFNYIPARFQQDSSLFFFPKACSRLIVAKFHYNPKLFPTYFQLFLSLFPDQFQFDLSSVSVWFKLNFRSFPVCSQLVNPWRSLWRPPWLILLQFQLVFSLFPALFSSFPVLS